MNINKLKFCPLILLTIFVMLVFGCSKSTEGKSGKLSGTVILNNDTGNPALDPVDYAGVTVALYKPAELDTTFVRLNNTYPNLGVQVSQETEFDHRLQNPVKVTHTAGDGSFSLNNIKPGTYNLVVMKEGWGVRYLYDVDIAEGDNTVSSKNSEDTISNTDNKASYSKSVKENYLMQKSGSIELYPVTQLAGYINNPFEFKSNHSYLAINDASFTGEVIFSPNSYIWINSGKKIYFYNLVSSPTIDNDFIKITSADKIYSSTRADSISRFYSFNFTEQAQFSGNRLNNIVFSHSTFGMVIKIAGITISNIVCSHCLQGLTIEQTNNVTITNCNVSQTDDPEQGGITLSDCSNTLCSNLIIKDCKVGIRQHSCDNGNIDNCYFCNNSLKDIYNLYDNTSNVTHCTFENSNVAIDNSGRSTTIVYYCNINAQIGINNYAQTNWVAAFFTANYNNFNCSIYGIRTFAVFYSEYHFNATYNYWGTTNESIISGALIYDRYDVDPSHQDYYRLWGIIDYIPYMHSLVQTAGIILERSK